MRIAPGSFTSDSAHAGGLRESTKTIGSPRRNRRATQWTGCRLAMPAKSRSWPTLDKLLLSQLGHDQLQVLPDDPLRGGRAQEVGGVVGRQDLDALVRVKATAQRADRGVGLADEPGGRELAERDDDLRAQRGELFLEERLTSLDLVGFRVAVAGRTAFQDVTYVDVLPRVPHRRDHLRQELPGVADERLPLDVLVRARRLAD